MRSTTTPSPLVTAPPAPLAGPESSALVVAPPAPVAPRARFRRLVVFDGRLA